MNEHGVSSDTESSQKESTQDDSLLKAENYQELVELITQQVFALMLSDLRLERERRRYGLRHPYRLYGAG